MSDQLTPDSNKDVVDDPQQVDESPTSDMDAQPEVKKQKKGRKNKFIVLGALAVVLVFGVVGGLAWHEQPSFCNAICHTPMDPYVESYYNNTSVVAAQTSSNSTLSVTLHKESEQDLACLDCHIPSIGEQITEATKWVTGDYTIPLEPMEYDGESFCLRPECHEGISSRDDLNAVFADQKRNPHKSHQTKLTCDDCHKTHEQSVLYCSQCHQDMELPAGWLTYSQYQAQHKTST